MAIRKVWFIEEIEIDGQSEPGHRQTVMEFDSTSGDWIRPDNRLHNQTAIDRWDAVVAALSNLDGKDRSWIINPVALMDYCNNVALGRLRRERGQGDSERTLPNE